MKQCYPCNLTFKSSSKEEEFCSRCNGKLTTVDKPNQNEIPTPRTSALVEQLKRGDTSMDYFTLCCNLEKQLAEARDDYSTLATTASLDFANLKEQLTELRGLAKELDNQLDSFDYGESDNDGSAIRKARYAFQQFVARHNL